MCYNTSICCTHQFAAVQISQAIKTQEHWKIRDGKLKNRFVMHLKKSRWESDMTTIRLINTEPVFRKHWKIISWTELKFGTRKAEVLNSLIMKLTANENDTNGILQTFRSLLLSSSVHCILNILNFNSYRPASKLKNCILTTLPNNQERLVCDRNNRFCWKYSPLPCAQCQAWKRDKFLFLKVGYKTPKELVEHLAKRRRLVFLTRQWAPALALSARRPPTDQTSACTRTSKSLHRCWHHLLPPLARNITNSSVKWSCWTLKQVYGTGQNLKIAVLMNGDAFFEK